MPHRFAPIARPLRRLIYGKDQVEVTDFDQPVLFSGLLFRWR